MVAAGRVTDGGPAPLDPSRTGSPTVLRLVIGTQLRRLREAPGITRETAGDRIRASHAKISRLELGRVSFKERDIVDLLALYGVTEAAEREAFLKLVRQANTPGLVAPLLRRAARLVRDVRAARAGRLGDPRLPGAVRARVVPDRGVRPRGHRRGRRR